MIALLLCCSMFFGCSDLTFEGSAVIESATYQAQYVSYRNVGDNKWMPVYHDEEYRIGVRLLTAGICIRRDTFGTDRLVFKLLKVNDTLHVRYVRGELREWRTTQ